MIIAPAGFSPSKIGHLDLFCDWIEASILFQEDLEFISKRDVSDYLTDNLLFENQEDANIAVANAWYELNKRISNCNDNLSMTIQKNRIIKKDIDWKINPAHVFLLLLSLKPYYDWWAGPDHTEQGQLFELLTFEAFKTQFFGWEVYRTGWDIDNPTKLRNIAEEIIELLHEDKADLETWDSPYAKEMGLDLMCYRPFPDNNWGIPIYMMQCASGKYWDTKLETPSLKRWNHIITFKNHLTKAFSMPFAIQDRDFKQCVIDIEGILFERMRLLSAGLWKEDWMSKALAARIVAWAAPRINEFILRSYS